MFTNYIYLPEPARGGQGCTPGGGALSVSTGPQSTEVLTPRHLLCRAVRPVPKKKKEREQNTPTR